MVAAEWRPLFRQEATSRRVARFVSQLFDGRDRLISPVRESPRTAAMCLARPARCRSAG